MLFATIIHIKHLNFKEKDTMNLRNFSLITCLTLLPIFSVSADCGDCHDEQGVVIQQKSEVLFSEGLTALQTFLIQCSSQEFQKHKDILTVILAYEQQESVGSTTLHSYFEYLRARCTRANGITPSEQELVCKKNIILLHMHHVPKFIDLLTEEKNSSLDVSTKKLIKAFGMGLFLYQLNEMLATLETDKDPSTSYDERAAWITHEQEERFQELLRLTIAFFQARADREITEMPSASETNAQQAIIEWYNSNARDIIRNITKPIIKNLKADRENNA